MKIAIVAPSPVPFTTGGMENMMFGLYKTLYEETNHQVELIKLPSKEHSFWDLIETYWNFYKLDVSQFDVVIASKYPAWMIQHDNVIYYVAHRLRGLYDAYHYMNMPEQVASGNEYVDAILRYMEENPLPRSLDCYFDMLFDWKERVTEADKPWIQFPGSLIRKIIHYLDNYAFTKPTSKHYFAISETVKNRKDYFPDNSKVKVEYLPATKNIESQGEYKHIFMVSRLDSPKRIDLLIQAMKYVKSDIPLYIAGTGPEKEHLEELAKGDNRIHFLGYLSDSEVDCYYTNSIVIPYFPREEDYGLITVEAMMHKKPVITTTDSGGPTEFVTNGETGYQVPVNIKLIAEKIDFLAANPEEAKRMGENGYNLVKSINWTSIINSILTDVAQKKQLASERKRITLVSTFPIYPPQGGGAVRTFEICKELAKIFDVEIVSLDTSIYQRVEGEITPNLKEIKIPRTKEHKEAISELGCRAQFAAIEDIAEIRYCNKTPDFCEQLVRSISTSDLCIISHPYLYNTVKQYLNGCPFVYDAQDVEILIKKQMLPESDIKEDLLSDLYEVERVCCEKSVLIFCCSDEDKKKFQELYNVPEDKIIVIPNGVDTKKTDFVSVATRQNNKESLGLKKEKIGLFIGSWHQPNLDACEFIFRVATLYAEAKFLIMGSQCEYFKDRMIPTNVSLLGLLNEEEKKKVFKTVDFALNPMFTGSGTNLKMFDYMAAGIPIISTDFGTRGIDNKNLFFIANTEEEFAKLINDISWNDKDMVKRVINARSCVEANYDWTIIADKAIDALCKYL